MFCSTFTFQGLRIDEALRLYLEAFRLPGEAPVIQRLLETFTDNWHVRHCLSFFKLSPSSCMTFKLLVGWTYSLCLAYTVLGNEDFDQGPL